MISSEDKLLLDSRSAELKRAFQDIDSNDDKQLSKEELSSYLSKKSGKKFNNELLIEIFRTIDKDHNSQISIEEFIQGYTQAESLIKNKIESLKSQILSSTTDLSNSKKQLISSKARKNENILTVKVLTASSLKNFGISGIKKPAVVISCEGQEIITNPANFEKLE